MFFRLNQTAFNSKRLICSVLSLYSSLFTNYAKLIALTMQKQDSRSPSTTIHYPLDSNQAGFIQMFWACPKVCRFCKKWFLNSLCFQDLKFTAVLSSTSPPLNIQLWVSLKNGGNWIWQCFSFFHLQNNITPDSSWPTSDENGRGQRFTIGDVHVKKGAEC